MKLACELTVLWRIVRWSLVVAPFFFTVYLGVVLLVFEILRELNVMLNTTKRFWYAPGSVKIEPGRLSGLKLV